MCMACAWHVYAQVEPHDELVVLESSGLAATTSQLLSHHQIAHDRSADLRADAAASSLGGAGGAAAAGDADDAGAAGGKAKARRRR